MEKKFFSLPNNESIALAVVNMSINGEVREAIPAFTQFSIRRRNPSKTMESVDMTKILPTVFGFTSPSIFRDENVQLFDFNGNEIPDELDKQVLVYLDKADNLNLFEYMAEPLPAEIVQCENVADAYNRISISFALSQVPTKDEWIGLCEASTLDRVLSDILEFININKVNGTAAPLYFGLRFTIAELKRAAVTKTSPLGDDAVPRSKEEAEKLYSVAANCLTAKVASQTRVARALNQVAKKYTVEDVVEALDDIKLNDQKAIVNASCEDKESQLISYISEYLGRRKSTAA